MNNRNNAHERQIFDDLTYDVYRIIHRWEYERDSTDVEIHILLEAMGINDMVEISDVDFSHEIKCDDLPNDNDESSFYNEPSNRREILDIDPSSIIEEPEKIAGKEIVLGEYYPHCKKIVLYYNAIMLYITPMVVRLFGRRRYHPYDFAQRCLITAFSIVYAHEYFHAVHHQNGDFYGSSEFLCESLARYFELLYCGVVPCSEFGTEYARVSRLSLKKCPPAYKYRGALAFDELLGTRVSDYVNRIIKKCRNYYNKDLLDALAPRYEYFKMLFLNSKYQTNNMSFIDNYKILFR